MIFDELNNSSSSEKPNKEEVNERAKIISELNCWATQNGNPLIFEDYGSELIQNTKINEEVLKNFNKKDIDFLDKSLKVFKSFVASPIFTDSFLQDHNSRRIWDTNNLQKVSIETQKYYVANRLRGNNFSKIIMYLDLLIKK